MEDKLIRKTLTDSLATIESDDFNDKILATLSQKKAIKTTTIFNSKDLVITTVLLCIIFIYTIAKTFNSIDQTTLSLSISLCFAPLFFIVFNKIHQLTINQNSK